MGKGRRKAAGNPRHLTCNDRPHSPWQATNGQNLSSNLNGILLSSPKTSTSLLLRRFSLFCSIFFFFGFTCSLRMGLVSGFLELRGRGLWFFFHFLPRLMRWFIYNTIIIMHLVLMDCPTEFIPQLLRSAHINLVKIVHSSVLLF